MLEIKNKIESHEFSCQLLIDCLNIKNAPKTFEVASISFVFSFFNCLFFKSIPTLHDLPLKVKNVKIRKVGNFPNLS